MVISHSKLFWGVKWGRDPIEVLKETVEMWVSPTASYLSPPSTAKRIDAMMFFWLSNLCWSSKGLLLNLKSWIRSKSVDSKRIPGRQTNGCPQIDSRSAGSLKMKSSVFILQGAWAHTVLWVLWPDELAGWPSDAGQRQVAGTSEPQLQLPLMVPPSRVVRLEEAMKQLWAVKDTIHNFWISSCNSG